MAADRPDGSRRDPIAKIAGTDGSVEDKSKAFAEHFGLGSVSDSRLAEEFSRMHLKDIKMLSQDIDKCDEAVKSDGQLVSKLDALSKDPDNKTLRQDVARLVLDDLTGDKQALVDDPKNWRRAAYVAALDDAVLNNPQLRKQLTPEQIEAIKKDRGNKLQDVANCLNDVPNELAYMKNDARLLQALRGSDPAELQSATQAVRADKENDIKLEGVRGSDGKAGTGYIGQSERSITSDRETAEIGKSFQVKRNGNHHRVHRQGGGHSHAQVQAMLSPFELSG